MSFDRFMIVGRSVEKAFDCAQLQYQISDYLFNVSNISYSLYHHLLSTG